MKKEMDGLPDELNCWKKYNKPAKTKAVRIRK